jgi:hypothetical protein
MAMTLITTNTESGDATSSFTASIDSTYKLYIFKFIDINPATDGAVFLFNGSIDAGSNYNVTKTTSFFNAHQQEDDGDAGLNYRTGNDLSQSTDFQYLQSSIGNGADESAAGTLWLFNPSSTTYVKHFYSRLSNMKQNEELWDCFMAGYFNTTDNIDAVQFKMDSGNFDGTIKMYGVG